MAIFQTQQMWLPANVSSKQNVLDAATAAEPEAWWARDLVVNVNAFQDAGQTLLDVSDIQSATLTLKDPSNLDGAALVTVTLTAGAGQINNAATLAEWQGFAGQQMQFAIPADALSFGGLNTDGERLLHLVLTVVTTGGKTGTLCVGTMNIVDDGGNSPGDNPVNAITVAQAQAMVAALGWAGAVQNLGAAATIAIGYAQSWLTGRQPVSLAAGAGAYVINLTLTDADALAGALLRIPIDLPASVNPAINIYDGSVDGTLLQTITQPDAAQARSFYFVAGYDGANWHKEDGRWV